METPKSILKVTDKFYEQTKKDESLWHGLENSLSRLTDSYELLTELGIIIAVIPEENKETVLKLPEINYIGKDFKVKHC